MYLSPTSFYNQRLGKAPVDPNSTAIMATLMAAAAGKYELHYRDWATTVFVAGPDTPTQKVWVDGKEASTQIKEAFSAVPIPPHARPPGPWPGDNHMVIIQPSTGKWWEGWKWSQLGVDGAHSGSSFEGVSTLNEPGWHVGFGAAVQTLYSSPGYFDANSWPGVSGNVTWSGPASGLFLPGGLVTPAEAQRLHIQHALMITAPTAALAKTFRWPAKRTDGSGEGANLAQEGMCLTFDDSHDFALVKDPLMKALCVAIRDYGAYVLFKGSNIAVKFESQATIPGTQSYGTDAWKGPKDEFGSAGALLSKSSNLLAAEIPWAEAHIVPESYRPSSIAPGLLV